MTRQSGQRSSACADSAVTDAVETDATMQRAATMLPPELLDSGEIIVLLVKPSPWFILLVPIQSLLMVALATIGLTLAWAYLPISHMVSQRDIVLSGMGVIGLRLFWQLLEWLSRVYVLTDQRVITVSGVLRVIVFQTQLTQIQNTNMVFSIRERLFRLGTITFATAGTGHIESVWQMLARPLEVHKEIVRVIGRYRR